MVNPDTAGPPPDDSPWDDLVISILSINQYSLERTYAAKRGLQDQKFTDLQIWSAGPKKKSSDD